MKRKDVKKGSEIMKNLLIILGVLVLFSFTAVDGGNYDRVRIVAPLKQKAIIVTGSYKKMTRYIKYGWVCEDVDIAGHEYYGDTKFYYTLVKY